MVAGASGQGLQALRASGGEAQEAFVAQALLPFATGRTSHKKRDWRLWMVSVNEEVN